MTRSGVASGQCVFFNSARALSCFLFYSAKCYPTAASLLTTTIYLSSIGAINRMKREWTDLEFTDWALLPSEAALLANKTGPTRLGFAVCSATLPLVTRMFLLGHDRIIGVRARRSSGG